MAAASWGGKEALRKGTVEKPTLPNTIDLLEINYKSNYFYRHCLCLHAHQYSDINWRLVIFGLVLNHVKTIF